LKDYFHDSRFIVNATIMLLAGLVNISGIFFIWDSYQIHQASQYLHHNNNIVDSTIDAAGYQALERGLTSAALGMKLPPKPEFYQRIQTLRNQGDTLWNLSLREASWLSQKTRENDSYITVIKEANLAFKQLQLMRSQIDEYLNGNTTAYVTLQKWVETITHFINTESELRELAFTSTPLPDKVIGINQVIKRRIWMMSEHAGQERAHIGYYSANREPVPEEIVHQLFELRGVVRHSYEDLLMTIKLQPQIDLRITNAIAQMQKIFFTDFQTTRIKMYAATDNGVYPYTAEEWIEQSTQAINSILAVGRIVSTITEENASIISEKALYQFLLNIFILIMTLSLTIWSLIKVRQTVNSLFHQKELAEVTLHSIGDAVITTDEKACVEYLNPIAEELTGWKTTEARGKHLNEIFIIHNGFTLEPEINPIEKCLLEGNIVGLGSNVVLTNHNGKEIMIEDSAAPIRDHEGIIVGAVMVFYDVTSMRNTPHLLSYHATHDALTGLYNRREFERQLSALILEAKNTHSQHALCYIDLDQFKVINDTSGHMVGDKLLQQLTYILKKHIRDADMLARLGGDEFGLLLKNCDLDRSLKIAESLRKTIKDFRFSWNKNTFELGASIGLVPILDTSVSPAEILSEADAACYAAKEKGRNRVQVYQTGNLELARRHGEMQWVARINDAINEDRLILYAQPIIALTNKDTHYFEILLRLIDTNGAVIAPMAFIPAAERYNLMPDIDYLVIKKSIQLLAKHYLSANPQINDIKFSINLSGATLGKDDLLDFIRNLIRSYKIPNNSICFEITETAAISNLEQATTLIQALRSDGCSFALDDFGSGLCSFNYLKSLPVDYLKIDGAFVRDIREDKVNYTVVKSASQIARVLNMKTIAEYVEDSKIIPVLRELNVDYAQGFALGRPEPVEDWLNKYTNLSSLVNY